MLSDDEETEVRAMLAERAQARKDAAVADERAVARDAAVQSAKEALEDYKSGFRDAVETLLAPVQDSLTDLRVAVPSIEQVVRDAKDKSAKDAAELALKQTLDGHEAEAAKVYGSKEYKELIKIGDANVKALEEAVRLAEAS